MPLIYLGALPDNAWTAVLAHALEASNRFLVHMPIGEDLLSNGRKEFEALPEVTVQPWSGMREAVELAGPLGIAARAAFVAAESSVELLDLTRKLWDYRLLVDAEVVLSVSDFTDVMIAESRFHALRAQDLLPIPRGWFNNSPEVASRWCTSY